MLKEAIYHINDIPYLFTVGEHEVKIRIRTKRGDVSDCTLLHVDRYQSPGYADELQLERIATTDLHDYFEGVVYSETKRLRYQFLLSGYDGSQVWCGEYGVSESRHKAGYFHCAAIAAADEGDPPSWVRDAVVYQIFPERFANGNPALNPAVVTDWNSANPPEGGSFYGGDIPGIIRKLPYLHELGINVIYLTPLFESGSNHKYDTTDYYSIDPHFGNLDDLKLLVAQSHSNNIKVVLDAVFNHTGDQFFAFQDLLKNGENSKYKDWFFVKSFPVVQFPVPNYETFGINIATMPKLNTKNPEVVHYLLDVAKYWIREAGIDGWRLDVANEVDHSFWRKLRQEIKGIDRELLLVGEIMHQAGAWVRGDQFDGVMNYLLRDALIDFFAKQTITARAFIGQLESIRMQYTDRANAAMFNLIGSHDTSRFLFACSESVWGWNEKHEIARLKLAAVFQLTYTGMPMIYYGDEIGMTGGEDPDCRRPMVWEQERQNSSILAHYKQMISIRAEISALRDGEFRIWFVEEAINVFGYIRRNADQCVAILLNNSPNSHQLTMDKPLTVDVRSITTRYGDAFDWGNGKIEGDLSPYGASIIVLNENNL